MLNLISGKCDRGSLGTAMGVHEGTYGVGMCLGPLVGGVVADAYSPQTLYLALSALSLTIIPLIRHATRET